MVLAIDFELEWMLSIEVALRVTDMLLSSYRNLIYEIGAAKCLVDAVQMSLAS